jgi:hypothetical protein
MAAHRKRRERGKGKRREGVQGSDFSVEGGDKSLRLLEVAFGLLGIEDRGDEERPVVATGQQSTVGSKEILPAVEGMGCNGSRREVCTRCYGSGRRANTCSRRDKSLGLLYDEDTKHLAPLRIGQQEGLAFHVCFHPLSGRAAERVRVIVEWVVQRSDTFSRCTVIRCV